MTNPYTPDSQNPSSAIDSTNQVAKPPAAKQVNNSGAFSENKSKNDNNLLITSSENCLAQQSPNLQSPPHDKEWGIDTVYLSIRASDDVPELAHNSWQQIEGKQNAKSDKTSYVSNFAVGFANVRVFYMPIYSSIFFQFNAPRILSRKSADLLPPNALEPLVASLLLQLVPQIPVLPEVVSIDQHGTIDLVEGWTKQVKFTRLDCARNLFVDCPEYVKHALSKVRSKYQKTLHIYSDDTGWTRANTTKSAGQDRIYDKSAELRNLELEERFHWDKKVYRFESQLQGDRLITHGLKTLDRVTNEAVWKVLEARWESCGWDIRLPGDGDLGELLGALSEKERIPFAGYLAIHAEGMGDLIDDKLNRRFTKIAKKLGLVPGFPLSGYRKMTHYLSLWHGSSIQVPEGV